jgi:carboxypeptidase Q
MKRALLLLALALPLAAQSPAQTPTQRNAERIAAAALTGNGAWEVLEHLTDNIGPRLSGSKGADLAVKWTTERFRSWGIDVRNEPVKVPHWVRGEEWARLVSQNDQKIVLTALGGSVATPRGGLTADVVEVTSYDQLTFLGREKLAGKIVFLHTSIDMDQIAAGDAFGAYSDAVKFRSGGPSRAAEFGAVAVVIRSVSSASLRTPHTGSLRYDVKQPKIPGAAMSEEDALLIHRLLAKGNRVRMHLVLTPKTMPDVMSSNVVAEIKGSERPDEIVLIGGHLDSWDLGTGAIDDGSGVGMVMDTMRIIHSLGLKPKRTIRCVLFMNEENGVNGGRTYFAMHGKEKHVAAIESDAGVGAPEAIFTTLTGARLEAVAAMAGPVLARAGQIEFITKEETGADTSFLIEAGVPGFGMAPDARRYFHVHHSPADTLDKVDPKQLAQNTAALAALAWVMAEE